MELNDRPRTRMESRLYFLALLLTFLVRAAAVMGTDPQDIWSRWSQSVGTAAMRGQGVLWDQALYDAFGWNVATEGVLGVGARGSAFCMPAYPVFLAAVYKIAGHLPGAARWAQVFLNVLAAVLLGALARRLGGRRAQIIAVFIVGMYPFFIYFVREILTEALFVFAFAATLLTASRVGSRGRLIDGVLYGMATGVQVMTRSVGFFLVPGTLILARPWVPEGRKRRLGALLLAALIVAGVWGSWILRNRRTFGEPVLLDTHGGWSLYMGALQARGVDFSVAVGMLGYQHGDILKGSLPGGSRGELEADNGCREKAMKLIREDPAGFGWAVLGNIRQFWLGSDFGHVADNRGMQLVMTLAGLASYLPVLLLGLLGLISCWRIGRRDFFWAALVLMATTSILHGTVNGGKRYRAATLDPVLIILASSQAASLLARWWPEPSAESSGRQ